jgi:hypothetical protein
VSWCNRSVEARVTKSVTGREETREVVEAMDQAIRADRMEIVVTDNILFYSLLAWCLSPPESSEGPKQ